MSVIVRCGEDLGEKVPRPPVDLVDDGAHLFDWLASGVREVPVEVALACEDRARVATTYGDDHVGAASGLIGEGLGELLGDVEAALGEDLHHSGVDLLPGRRPGRPDGDAPGAVVVEQNASGDGAPRVVRADDEYLGGVGHDGSLCAGERSEALDRKSTRLNSSH